MKGHTNKATINKRRAPTENMWNALSKLVDRGRVKHMDLSQSDANAIRAMCDRGYATFNIEDRSYSATDVGRMALHFHRPIH